VVNKEQGLSIQTMRSSFVLGGRNTKVAPFWNANQELPGEEAIEQLVENLLREYKKRFGVLSPPIEPARLAQLVGAKVEEAPDSIASEGQLLPIRGGFIIRYRRGALGYRTNLTICHEIAHIFFYDPSQSIPKRPFGNLPTQKEEHLCFLAARQLLVPKAILIDHVRGLLDRPSLDLLRELSNRFRASLPIMATRLTEDTSLIDNVMFTTWVCRDSTVTSNQSIQGRQHNSLVSSSNIWTKRSYLSPALAKGLNAYRRGLILEKALGLVERVANNIPGPKAELLEIGKRRRFRVSLEGESWGTGAAVTATMLR